MFVILVGEGADFVCNFFDDFCSNQKLLLLRTRSIDNQELLQDIPQPVSPPTTTATRATAATTLAAKGVL